MWLNHQPLFQIAVIKLVSCSGADVKFNDFSTEKSERFHNLIILLMIWSGKGLSQEDAFSYTICLPDFLFVISDHSLIVGNLFKKNKM